MPQISVLVSVYNAVDTLPQCLDSLLHQTMKELQIICIDDASTDTSLQLLQRYQREHPDLIDIVALPDNHGQGYARNQGIPLVKAPLTAFLDSDDYLAPDALEQVLLTFQSHPATDCVLFDVRYLYPDGREHGYRTPPFQCMNGYDAFLKALKWDVHGWYVARTSLYQQFPYDDTCHSYSDDNTTMAHYLHAREVRCCAGKYYFVQRGSSSTHQATTRRFDWLRANESMHRQLVEWNMPHEVIDLYEENRWYVLIDCFWFYYRNRAAFTAEQRSFSLQSLRRAWESIDTSTCLPAKIKLKPGYMPLHPFWNLFKWQEWALYIVRKLRHTPFEQTP